MRFFSIDLDGVDIVLVLAIEENLAENTPSLLLKLRFVLVEVGGDLDNLRLRHQHTLGLCVEQLQHDERESMLLNL